MKTFTVRVTPMDQPTCQKAQGSETWGGEWICRVRCNGAGRGEIPFQYSGWSICNVPEDEEEGAQGTKAISATRGEPLKQHAQAII